jgi:hypothetical protein
MKKLSNSGAISVLFLLHLPLPCSWTIHTSQQLQDSTLCRWLPPPLACQPSYPFTTVPEWYTLLFDITVLFGPLSIEDEGTLKCRELFNQQHSVTAQKTCTFSNSRWKPQNCHRNHPGLKWLKYHYHLSGGNRNNIIYDSDHDDVSSLSWSLLKSIQFVW